MNRIISLHERALSLAGAFRETEASLVGVLMELDAGNGFLALSYPSCFEYCRSALGFSEAQAFYLSKVAKKSREVPELKEAIDAGRLTVSQARRIVPVVTTANVTDWVEKAAALPQRELEREVAAVNPKALPETRIRPVAKDMSELRMGISVDLEKKLGRVRDLLAQKTGRSVSLQDALEMMAELFIEKHDPLKKAERATTKALNAAASDATVSSRKPADVRAQSVSQPNPVRPGSRYIPAEVAHQVTLRDRSQCRYRQPNGARCTSQRWVQLHHRTPVANGGTHTIENLVTLCSAHHKAWHQSHSHKLSNRQPTSTSAKPS